jgi:hypothetical protein
MTTNGHGRRDVDEVLVAALAAGASYEEAARAAGVSKSTVRRRMGEAAFRARVFDTRDELLTALRGRLLRAAPFALRRWKSSPAAGRPKQLAFQRPGRFCS